MKRLLTLSACAFLALAACTPEEEAAVNSLLEDDAMMESSSSADAMMEDDSMAQDQIEEDDSMDNESDTPDGVYEDFDASVIGNGETSVLFFAAAWCPVCVEDDKLLSSLYPAADMLSVYKVDYDTSAELKSKYGIVQQHTFVKIDGEGNAVQTLSFPSEAQLKSLLSA